MGMEERRQMQTVQLIRVVVASPGDVQAERDCLPAVIQSKVERIRTWLIRTLQHGALPSRGRAQADDALAQLGDTRFRGSEAWYLPNEPLLGFVEIPTGPFLMGSDDDIDSYMWLDAKPQHTVTLPTYYMARYPVTVAQFRVFVEASGYELTNRDSLEGSLYHPVVWVTWHDALAYCDWLTTRLREWPETPEPRWPHYCDSRVGV